MPPPGCGWKLTLFWLPHHRDCTLIAALTIITVAATCQTELTIIREYDLISAVAGAQRVRRQLDL